MGTDYMVNRPQVVDEVIDGEAVMINLVTGRYYCTNAVGALVWQGLVQGGSTDQITGALAAVFSDAPADLADHVAAMLRRLEEEGLVVAGGSPAAESVDLGAAVDAYVVPEVEVFTDLTDLLLLDPVHDVDPAGWPHTPS